MKGLWNDERDPLTALQAGRTDLFEAFVETETPTFLAFFRRLGATPGEAEDLTQDTFLKLYEHASKYRASDRFVPFARRVARNAWIDRRRRRTLRGVGRTDEEEGSWADRIEAAEVEPLSKLEQLDEAQRIELALDSLSDLHRAVFELGVLQELPYTEIAEEMNIPVGTVKSRMFYAVRKLREALHAQDDEAAIEALPSDANAVRSDETQRGSSGSGLRPGLAEGGAA